MAGSVFSVDVDLSKTLGDLSKASEALKGFDGALGGLSKASQEFSKTSKSTNVLSDALDIIPNTLKNITGTAFTATSSLANVFAEIDKKEAVDTLNAGVEALGGFLANTALTATELVNSINNLGDAMAKMPLLQMGKGFSFLENVGNGAFNTLILGAKAFGLAIKSALGPLRMVFFVLELILSLNPFGKLSDLLGKLNDLAKGSTEHTAKAKDMKVDPKKLRAFTQASEVHKLGYDEKELGAVYQNLRSPDRAHSFATLGIDRESAKKLDGTDLSMLLLKQLEQNIKNAGGWDSDATQIYKDAYSDAGGNIEYAQARFRNANAFQKDFKTFHKRDAGGDEALSSFEKSMKRLGVSFENLYRKVMLPLYPLMESFVNVLEKGVIWLGEMFDKVLAFIQNFSLEGFSDKAQKTWDKAKGFFGGVGDSLKGMAKNNIKALSNMVSNPSEALDTFTENAKKNFEIAKNVGNSYIDTAKDMANTWTENPNKEKVDVNINLQTKGDKILVEARTNTNAQLAAEYIRVGAK